MDIGLLATAAATVLGPLLSSLLKTGGDKAMEAVGEKVGEGLFDKARALWGKLGKKVEAKPGAPEAAKALADHPDDEDARAMMALQLKSILAADPRLAAEVEDFVNQSPAGSVMIANASGGSVVAQGGGVAAGHGGIAIGGNVFGSVRRDLDEEGRGGGRPK